MIAVARANRVLIEPKLVADQFAEELKAKTGLELSTPSRQGLPTMGRVASIGARVKNPDFALGDIVFFYMPRPVGFDFGGKTLFSMKPKNIKAKLVL